MNSRLRHAIHKKNMFYNAYKKGKVKWTPTEGREIWRLQIGIFSRKMWRWSQKSILLENDQTLYLK